MEQHFLFFPLDYHLNFESQTMTTDTKKNVCYLFFDQTVPSHVTSEWMQKKDQLPEGCRFFDHNVEEIDPADQTLCLSLSYRDHYVTLHDRNLDGIKNSDGIFSIDVTDRLIPSQLNCVKEAMETFCHNLAIHLHRRWLRKALWQAMQISRVSPNSDRYEVSLFLHRIERTFNPLKNDYDEVKLSRITYEIPSTLGPDAVCIGSPSSGIKASDEFYFSARLIKFPTDIRGPGPTLFAHLIYQRPDGITEWTLDPLPLCRANSHQESRFVLNQQLCGFMFNDHLSQPSDHQAQIHECQVFRLILILTDSSLVTRQNSKLVQPISFDADTRVHQRHCKIRPSLSVESDPLDFPILAQCHVSLFAHS